MAKDFIEKNDNENKVQINDFQDTLSNIFKTNNINVYKIASIDLRNYFCCSSHKIFLHNPNKINIEENFSVFAGTHMLVKQKKHI